MFSINLIGYLKKYGVCATFQSGIYSKISYVMFPVTVESQSDFHIKTYGSTSTTIIDNGIRTIHETIPEIVTPRHTTAIMTTYPTIPPPIIILTPKSTHSNMEQEIKSGRNIEVEIVNNQGTKEVEVIIAETTTITTTTEEETTTAVVTTTTERETTTRTTTTSTTPEPVKYCVVQRPELDDQFVQKGHTRRVNIIELLIY